MGEPACRACHGHSGQLVLDLGEQPACDYFPPCDDQGPDPVYPLQMWLCSSCGLTQLVADATMPEEPKGTEPAALVIQAADAVERVAAAGLLPDEARVAEYGSPHGGSWLGLLAERTARVSPGGVLLLQYHSLNTIIRCGQWNALRHGHYAYYSTTALAAMLAANGFSARTAWQFELYGGTVLLAARRGTSAGGEPDGPVQSLLEEDARVGVRDAGVLKGLQDQAQSQAVKLHDWLVSERSAGRTVLGYGAASRAVAFLRLARVGRSLLPAVVDASPGKQGLRMPGTDIPVVDPSRLTTHPPAAVLLFVTDLLKEARAAFPEVEAAGGRWVTGEMLGFQPAGG